MKNIRFLAALLAALTLALSACGGTQGTAADDTTTDKTTSADTDDTTPAETDRSQVKDDLPVKDYGGDKFTILYRNEWAYEFIADEENGDILNDAVFRRNRAVEDRFKVSFEFVGLPGTWNSSEYKNAITNSVVAGDSEYDLITGYQADMINHAMQGYFMNVYDMPYINTEAPWWSEKSNSALTVHDKLFMTTGDIAVTLWDNMYVMFFNKKLAEQYAIPDMYEIVDNHEWTIDKLAELSKNVSNDVDGNSVYDENDLYGFVTSPTNHMRAWMVAGETPLTKLNDNGEVEACFMTERTINMVDRLKALHKQQSSYSKNEVLSEPYSTDEPVIFTSDRALFMTGYLGNAKLLRNMDTDFGIIPYPMYDENQDGYRTTSHNSVSMMCFPVTLRDNEMSGIITEALCAESYRNVIPDYYDLVLKTKGTRDDQSAEMMDQIRDGLTFDFGWVHSPAMDNIGWILQDVISEDKDLSSYWASKEKKVNAGLEKINAAYEKAGE